MDIADLQSNWDHLGRIDPLRSILVRPVGTPGDWEIEEFFATGRREIELAMAHLESLGLTAPHGKALDFGCGAGRLTQALAQYFDEVHAVDIAPSMIELANKYNMHGPRCKYYVNGTGDLELFPDSSFDFVYTSITLQHMEPQYSRAYVREFLRVLVPHGLVMFDVPELHPRTLKGVLIRITPLPMLSGYRQLIYRLTYRDQPVSEMHWMKRKDVVRLIKQQSGKTLDIARGKTTGVGWVGYRYCATKE